MELKEKCFAEKMNINRMVRRALYDKKIFEEEYRDQNISNLDYYKRKLNKLNNN